MRKFLVSIFCALCFFAQAGGQQLDSSKVKALDTLLDDYVSAIALEPVRVKNEECDFMISSCTDSLLKQYAAIRLYEYFFTSKLMGDDAVAIHIYDEWFAPGKVRMASEIDAINAGIYAEFNRRSLIGCRATELELSDPAGGIVVMPTPGSFSVLFFYDTSCKTCRAESILLRNFLQKGLFSGNLYAVYIGDDAQSWEAYRTSVLNVDNEAVTVYHLWDPEQHSDMLRIYGLLQTPGMFLLAADGTIIGRGLNTEALVRLLKIYEN